jgi:MFS superfamily sulfate permease-like transporter
MWKPDDNFTRQSPFVSVVGILATFLVTSFFVIFGVEIDYALLIGIVSGIIIGFFAFQRDGENT